MALLVVGAQSWLVNRTHDARKALEAATATAKVVKQNGGLVLLVRHVRPWAAANPHVLPHRDEAGCQLAWSGAPPDIVVEAGGVSAFQGSSLDEVLRGATSSW